jgi:hypothetical protein
MVLLPTQPVAAALGTKRHCRGRRSAARSSARPSMKVSDGRTAGQPKRSNKACRRAWRFTSGCGRQSCSLRPSRSNAHRWIVPGLVQRTCSLAKFGRSSRSLAGSSDKECTASTGSVLRQRCGEPSPLCSRCRRCSLPLNERYSKATWAQLQGGAGWPEYRLDATCHGIRRFSLWSRISGDCAGDPRLRYGSVLRTACRW